MAQDPVSNYIFPPAPLPPEVLTTMQHGSRSQSVRNAARLAGGFVLIWIAASCGGVVTPDAPPVVPLNVTLSVTKQSTPSVRDSANGNEAVSCNISLSAAVDGGGIGSWTDGVVRIYLPKDTTTAIDSMTFLGLEIRALFSQPNIETGVSESGVWTVASHLPFFGEFVFHYQPAGGTAIKTTTVRFDCAPANAGTAAPPAITSLSVTPPSGTLSAGLPLLVNFSATSASALWQTKVDVTGPCVFTQVFNEKIAPTTTRAVTIPLPPSCQLGTPFTVKVSALDAAGRATSSTISPTLSIIDDIPPKIESIYGAEINYFAGDSILYSITTSDNRAVAAILWTVLPYGAKDSVVGPGGVGFRVDGNRVATHGDWLGPLQVTFVARDGVGLLSAPVTMTQPLYGVVSRPAHSGTINGSSAAYAVDGRRGLIYVAQDALKQLAVVSMSTLQVTATLPLPGAPLDLDITQSGDSLIIGMPDQASLGVVDLRQPALALTSLPLLAPARGVRVLSNGHAIVAIRSTTQAGKAALLDVDLATGAARVRTDPAISNIGSTLMERSLDGSVLVLNSTLDCLRRYVVSTDAFGPCGFVDDDAFQPTADATGQRVAVGGHVYDTSMHLMPGYSLSVGEGQLSLLSADGLSLFELVAPGFVRLDASQRAVLDRTTTPVVANIPGHLTADGTTLVVLRVLNGSTMIGVVDMR